MRFPHSERLAGAGPRHGPPGACRRPGRPGGLYPANRRCGVLGGGQHPPLPPAGVYGVHQGLRV